MFPLVKQPFCPVSEACSRLVCVIRFRQSLKEVLVMRNVMLFVLNSTVSVDSRVATNPLVAKFLIKLRRLMTEYRKR
jgi:hypothetical protein